MNVEDIRKVAMQQKGREALEERFGAPQLGALEHVLLHKQAGQVFTAAILRLYLVQRAVKLAFAYLVIEPLCFLD